jgi:GntR family transcriptional regulator, transcriptional repressor for pyruvate dehydrogenase complex
MSSVRRVASHPLETVVAGMQNRILERAYPVDSRLPSEAELQQEWGVSRSVVREAMKMLASKGLVRIEQGRGTFVNASDAAPLRQQLEWVLQRGGSETPGRKRDVEDDGIEGWDALLDVRLVLEAAVAERAARSAQPSDFSALSRAIDALHAHADDAVTSSEDDVAFHMALALATQNALYPALLGSLYDLLRRYMVQSYTGTESALEAAREHEAILQAVRARDAEGAATAMRFHLRSSEADLALARQQSRARN